MEGDHGDDLFSVLGAPFLKGKDCLLAVALVICDLGLDFFLMALSKCLLLKWCF